MESSEPSVFEKLLKSESLDDAVSVMENMYVPLEKDKQIRDVVDDLCMFGGYPEFLFRKNSEDRKNWLGSYHQTYLETDLRQLVELRNPESFEVFEKLFAIHVGNLLNISELGRDCSLSNDTARRFINYYKQLFVTWQAKPWHASVGKRMMKMSKYYFYDTGVLRSVLGDFLQDSPGSGQFFENTILSEMKKIRCFTGYETEIHFCRTSTGVEVDAFVKTLNGRVSLFFEIKQSEAVHAKDIRHLRKYVADDDNAIGVLVNCLVPALR
jgi:predicted AAA+ superfamily ATPase